MSKLLLAALLVASGNGVVVTLLDEPCALAAVTNLPRRATWLEAGNTIEGCWAQSAILPLVLTYWADRTVVAIPASAFAASQGT